MSKRGKFIVIDGPDGVGKSTVVKLLSLILIDNTEFLYDQYTKDSTCKSIKDIIITKGKELDSNTLALLSMASRTILDKKITNSISSGLNVICDRYLSSTLVLNTDSLDDIYNVRLASKTMNACLEPDMYIILKYANIEQAKEPENSMEEKIPPKIQQSKFNNISNILNNVYYIEVDHNKSALDTIYDIMVKLSIYEEYSNCIELFEKTKKKLLNIIKTNELEKYI